MLFSNSNMFSILCFNSVTISSGARPLQGELYVAFLRTVAVIIEQQFGRIESSWSQSKENGQLGDLTTAPVMTPAWYINFPLTYLKIFQRSIL